MKYKDWTLLEELPHGWNIDKTVGSPLHGYNFATDGKSILNEQKRALVKVQSKKVDIIDAPTLVQKKVIENEAVKPIDENFIFPSKAVNILARKRFQEQLLKEIMFDFMVCEIEGWDKMEYLRELKKLINSFQTKIKHDNSADREKQTVLSF